MKIGIGITTRNRPDVLRCSLEHWKKDIDGSGMPIRLVVVDDHSDMPIDTLGYPCYRLPKHSGIAIAKSYCLALLQDCDYIFLADDDIFPIQQGWEWPYIYAHLTTGIHHFVYMEPVGTTKEPVLRKVGQVVLEQYDSMGGVLLFLTKHALTHVGAYYMRYDVYGFEHVGYTRRIHRAGLMPGTVPATNVQGTRSFWWPMDWRGVPVGYSFDFKPSLPVDQARESTQRNSYIFMDELNGSSLYYPLPSLDKKQR